MDLHVDGGYDKQIWIAALIVAAVFAGVVLGARWSRRRRGAVAKGGMVTGRDNRRSTSKTIALAWTVVVGWMVVTEAFIAGLGLTYPAGNPATGDTAAGHPVTLAGQLASASLLYLVFLGGPYAAAAFALASTQSKIAAGQLAKPPSDAPSAFDLVADDDGNVDLYDLQYVLFNLLAVIIVAATFVAHAGAGLPAVPEFLAVLTGGSALTYTVNKAVATDTPRITAIMPLSARSHQSVSISGVQLTSRVAGAALPTVTIGGLPATVENSPVPDRLTVTVPAAPSGTQPLLGPAMVVVSPPNAVPVVGSSAGALTVVPDEPAVAQVDVSPPGPVKDSVISVSGTLLLAPDAADGIAPAGTSTAGGLGATLTVENGGTPWPVAFEGDYRNTKLTLKVTTAPPAGLHDGDALLLRLSRSGLTVTHRFRYRGPA